MAFLMNLSVVDFINDSPAAPELDGAVNLVTTTIGGEVFVYVAGSDDNGVQVLKLSSDGTLTPVTSVSNSAAVALQGANDLLVYEIGTKKFLVVSGETNDGVSVFEIDQTGADAGHLTPTDAVFDVGSLDLDGAWEMASHQAGGRSFLAVSAYNDDTVTLFELDGSGTLTKLSDVSDADNAVYELNGAAGLSFHTIGTRTFLYVAGDADRGLSVFEVSATGGLTHVTSLNGISTASFEVADIATGTVHGKDFLIVPDHYEGHFLVYELGANGVPVLTDTYNAYEDTSHGVWRNYTVDFVTIDGVPFLLSQGEASHSVDLYTLSSDGKMSYVTSVRSNQLSGVNDVEYVTMGEEGFILASDWYYDRATVIGLGVDDDALRGTTTDDVILGFSGEDDLLGRAGNDLLKGGSGDDVLSGGAGNDRLFGGSGDDVMAGGRGNDLLEGGAGADVMVGGLGLDTASYAESANGVALSLETGRGSGGDAAGDILHGIEGLTGSGYRDTLTGSSAANTIRGGGGADEISGLGGRDKLYGDKGNDRIDAGEGNDYAAGGVGNDTLLGLGGRDRLFGNGGNDTLDGGAGNDRLVGGSGADVLIGGADNDTLTGGSGADRFVFTQTDGFDTITDFTANSDIIDFSQHSAFNSFADVQAAVIDLGGDTIIGSGANALVLENLSSNQLDQFDFVF